MSDKTMVLAPLARFTAYLIACFALATPMLAFGAGPPGCLAEPEPIFDARHTGVSRHFFETRESIDASELLVLMSGLRVEVQHFVCGTYTIVFRFHPADPDSSFLSVDKLLKRVERNLREIILIDSTFDVGKRALRLIQNHPEPHNYEPTEAMVDTQSGGKFHFAFRNSPEKGGIAIMHFEIKL